MERRILIIDDDRSMCDVLDAELKRRGFEVTTTTVPENALHRLSEGDFDLVLTDINMHGMSGVDLCQKIVQSREDLPVVVMTAYGSMESAIAAIRAGAYDFVTKPFEMDDIALTIERALKHRALREEVKRLRRAVTDSQKFDDILGTSPAMKKMYDLGRPRRRDRDDGARHRRERHRQGARRQGDPPAQPAKGRTVRRDQLRRDAREPARE